MSAPTAMAHSSDDRCFVSTSLPKFPTQDIDEQVVEMSQQEYDQACRRSVDNAESFFEDEHVYANVQEMEEESRRREQPPTPDVTERPIRDLGNGWLEFLTETGRSYFFNSETGDCQWKPPRFLNRPSLVSAAMNGAMGHYDNVVVPLTDVPTHEDDSVASCSAPVSPLTAAKSLTDMVESVDSGIGRTSISVRNKVVDKMAEKRISMQVVSKELKRRVDAFKSSEELAAAEIAHLVSGSHRFDDTTSSDASCLMVQVPAMSFSQKSIKCGTLNKCKVAEAGSRLKKKEWSPCYIFLSSAHIIFYKDEKSAEKSGRHYEAPLGMCDLRGASLQWLEHEKDKRKKHEHIIQLELIDNTIYQFSTANSQDINGWFHALRQVISRLPRPDAYPTPVLERVNMASGISRNPSSLSHSHSSSPFISTPARHSTKKGKASSKDVMTSSTTDDGKAGVSSVMGPTETVPTRESIIEKLRRFFRSRPSIDSLKEKGIYRPEPVFGSTLQAICQHEHSMVPRFIQLVTEVIESRGLDTDGLYRVSGNLSAIQKIRCHVDQEKYEVLLREEDVHVLTGALKLFFRELSEPIFPVNLAKDFIFANRLPNGDTKVKAFDELLRKLPLINRETLKVLFGHLLRVANHADKNRMEIHNLAIMFGPSLFSSGLEPGSESKKRNASKKKAVDKKLKEKPTVQSNSHLAFNMIMQGQTVEFLLKEFGRFPILQGQAV
uniref:WW domain-containing protein tag-325 n=1 Tax=Ascaris suum TaxID=6253 RepID=F1KYG0_ASCSU